MLFAETGFSYKPYGNFAFFAKKIKKTLADTKKWRTFAFDNFVEQKC